MNRFIIVLLLLFGHSRSTYAQNKGSETLKPIGWTNDFEHIFSSNQIHFLDSVINAFEKETTNEITIVTIDSSMIQNVDFDNYITELGNSWGVGKKERNNGIIIGISRGGRKVRISNGYGIEEKLSDIDTKSIIDELMIPAFRQLAFFEGTKKGLLAIMEKLGEPAKTISTKQQLQIPVNNAISATFPLTLEKINFYAVNNIVQLDENIKLKIGALVKDYYFNDCSGDSSETYFSIKDIYFNTIQLNDSNVTIYLILLKHMPGEEINSKIIFYDNVSGAFIDPVFDFNLFPLYDLTEGNLTASGLKTKFKIVAPEIEFVDYDKGIVHKYRFTRLYHNGTSNAIETFILKVDKNKIERLDFKQNWLE